MINHPIYLDNAATTRVFDEAAAAVQDAMINQYGNPSSMHRLGFEAERTLKESREIFAKLLKCDPSQIFFTSGGTESNNTAVFGSALKYGGRHKHFILSSIEHPSVSEPIRQYVERGWKIDTLHVNRDGFIDLGELEQFMKDREPLLVSIMHVNNEIGTIEPISEAANLIHSMCPTTLFHVDDVQGFGKLNLFPGRAGVDLLSVSSHKIHGPKGVGLFYRSERAKNILPLIYGGGQQEGFRSGTENVPGIAGFAKAALIYQEKLRNAPSKLEELRNLFIEKVTQIEGTKINGPIDTSLAAPHIVSLTVDGVRSEVLLHALEEKSIYVSAGSACSSHKMSHSDTLLAIGLRGDDLDSTLRFSFSIENTKDEIETTVKALREIIPSLRKYRRL
ncbi:MAG: cysteine desulfurase [Lachnospiraceae bacterium]|nr:cysteine desulfurase [Lachnospiraceae bacterium]